MMCGSIFGMEVERQSPDSGNMLAAILITRHGSPKQSIAQRRGSLPDLRRGLALSAFRAIGDATPPMISPMQLSPLAIPPAETPHSDLSTPSGINLDNFVEPISVITVEREEALEDGWIERKKRAFKTSMFSRTSIDVKPFEFGTIVYQVNEQNKIYRMITLEMQIKTINESVAADARYDAIGELRRHLMQEVEKEASNKNYSVENMISDLTL
jgi:hypothetical protein